MKSYGVLFLLLCINLTAYICGFQTVRIFRMPDPSGYKTLGKHQLECDSIGSEMIDGSTIPDSSDIKRIEPIFIEDNFSISLDHFSVPVHYKDTLDSLLIPHGTVISRIDKLALDIIQDYKGQTIHLLCVLKGGSTFFHDLCKAISKYHESSGNSHVPYIFDFIRVSSYSGTNSTGEVRITGCDLEKLKGKHVLFVEDIIDTGLTMTKIFEFMKERIVPESVNVASLCEKRTPHSCGFKAKYVGFSIPDKFIVGYCMDYNEVYRDLSHIAVIGSVGIEKFKDTGY